MPNWCQNMLIVEGEANELKTFTDFIKGKDDEGKNAHFDFNKVISPEKDYERVRQDWEALSDDEKVIWKGCSDEPSFDHYWFNNGGYQWCVKHWGTKWNACDVSMDYLEPKKLRIMFSTAWSPCEPIIKDLAMMFNKLDFMYEYEEWGMAFAGIYETKKGRIVNESSWEIDIGECPECEYTNIKPRDDKHFECSDCGHKYTEDEVVEQ